MPGPSGSPGGETPSCTLSRPVSHLQMKKQALRGEVCAGENGDRPQGPHCKGNHMNCGARRVIGGQRLLAMQRLWPGPAESPLPASLCSYICPTTSLLGLQQRAPTANA